MLPLPPPGQPQPRPCFHHPSHLASRFPLFPPPRRDARVGGPAIRVLPAHADPVATVDWSPDGLHLLTASFDGLCRVWCGRTGRCVETLEAAALTGGGGIDEMAEGAAPLTCGLFAPNGGAVLAAGLDGCLRLWDLDETEVRGGGGRDGRGGAGVLVTAPPLLLGGSGFGSDARCAAAAFVVPPPGVGSREGLGGSGSPPPPMVACGAGDGSVYMWTLAGPTRGAGPGGLCAGPSSRLPAAAPLSAAGAKAEGEEAGAVPPPALPLGHASAVLGVEASADGRWLATCGADRTALIRRVAW